MIKLNGVRIASSSRKLNLKNSATIFRFLEAALKTFFESLLFSFLLLKGFFNSLPCHLFLMVFSNVIQLVIHIETIASQQQLKLGYHTLAQSLNRSHTVSLIRSLIHTLTYSFTYANNHTITLKQAHIQLTYTRTHTLTLSHNFTRNTRNLFQFARNLIQFAQNQKGFLLKITKSCWELTKKQQYLLKISNILSKTRTFS